MSKPWFVKITGPGLYQIKPYARAGWLIMGLWIILHCAVMSLLFIEAIRERWWIVVLLDLLVTVPFLIVAVKTAVPADQAARDEVERLRAGRGRRDRR